MKKRGSHVGIILSFVVFVLFVSFLYIAFKPNIKVQQNKELALEYLEKELIKLSTEKLCIATIHIIGSYNPQITCFNISHPNNFGTYNYALVKEGENNLIGSSKSTNLEFDISENQDFFKIYYSNVTLNPATLTEEDCEPAVKDTNYSIGLISTKEYIFESKLLALFENVTAQKNIGELINNEFNFGFTYFNGTTIWLNEIKELSTNIYVKKIPIQYVDEEANIKFGYLNIII